MGKGATTAQATSRSSNNGGRLHGTEWLEAQLAVLETEHRTKRDRLIVSAVTRRRMTQKQVARIVGLTPQRIGQIIKESGRANEKAEAGA